MSDVTDVRRRSFSEVTALEARQAGSFDGVVDAGWTIGGRPNGGYLLAMLGRAAAAVTDHPDVIAASAQFVQPPEPGPVVVRTEILRAGRSASQVRARIEQNGNACVESLVTLARIDPDAVPYWDAGIPPAGGLGFDECVLLEGPAPGGVRVALFDHVEVRLEPETLGFGVGAPTGRGELRGWLALPEDGAVRPGVAPVRHRLVSAGHLRHRVRRLGPDVRHDGLRQGTPAARPGPRRAAGPPDRRAAGRRDVLRLGQGRPPRGARDAAGRHPPGLTGGSRRPPRLSPQAPCRARLWPTVGSSIGSSLTRSNSGN